MDVLFVIISFDAWPTLGFATMFHLMCAAAVAAHCLRRPREPRSLLLWLFTVVSFPLLGALLYLMFGINRAPSKSLDKVASDRRFHVIEDDAPLPYGIPEIAHTLPVCWRAIKAGYVSPETPPPGCEALNALLARLYETEFPLLDGNAVEPFFEPLEAIEAMLDAIRGARRHVHLQTYIFGCDATGRRVLELLKEKAAQGVEVRLLYDAFGSSAARLRRFFAPFAGLPNLRILGFSQVNVLKRQFQINLRNHRKILVVDGAAAFVGGVNLHDAYARENVRDVHFRIAGPAVHQLQYTFLCDWFFISGEPASKLLAPEHFPADAPAAPAPAPAAADALVAGRCLARVLNGGAAEFPERYEDALFAILSEARARVWLTTPYFIPTDEILRVLRTSALRGLDVRVIVPDKNNHFYVQHASRAAYDALLSAGVRIFERHPPFSHSKLLLVDDRIVLFGSANFDTRSLRLNYETNVLAIAPELALRAAGFFNHEFDASSEFQLHAWRQRPLRHRMLENFYTLLNPVL